MKARRYITPVIVLTLVAGIIVIMALTIGEAEDTGDDPGSAPTLVDDEARDAIEARPITFAPWEPDLTAIDEELSAQIGPSLEKVRADPTTAGLLAHFTHIGRLAPAGYSDSSLAMAGAVKRFNALASQVAGSHGLAGYAAVGEIAYARFLEHLQRYLARKRALGAAPLDAQAIEHPSVVAGLYGAGALRSSLLELAYLPGFLTLARAEGMITDDWSLAADAEPIIHLMFRYRWARLARELGPAASLMAPKAYRAFRRWQIERSGSPLENKFAVLDKMEGEIAGYDVDRARGILYFQSGDAKSAHGAFVKARERAAEAGDDAATREIEGFLLELEAAAGRVPSQP